MGIQYYRVNPSSNGQSIGLQPDLMGKSTTKPARFGMIGGQPDPGQSTQRPAPPNQPGANQSTRGQPPPNPANGANDPGPTDQTTRPNQPRPIRQPGQTTGAKQPAPINPTGPTNDPQTGQLIKPNPTPAKRKQPRKRATF